MKNLILIIFLLLTLVGCKKDKNSFTLQVVEYGTQKPIAGARVDVYRAESSDLIRTGYIKYDELITNQNGEAFVDASERFPSQLRVYANQPNYFDAHTLSHGILNIGTSFLDHPVIELYPYAWLKIEVDWSVFEGEFDYLRTNSVGGCGSCPFIFLSDTIVGPIRVFGNRIENTIYIFGYKSGQETIPFQNNNIYCRGFDTTIHVLHR